MYVRQQVMLAATVAALYLMPAQAATEQAAPDKPAARAEHKPHSHAVEKGAIPPAAVPTEAEKKQHKPAKKPQHQHRKEKN